MELTGQPEPPPVGSAPVTPGAGWPSTSTGWGFPPPAPPPPEPQSWWRRAWQRFVGGLAAAVALLAKFGALLLKLKYVGTVLTMFVSVAAYTWLWGWTFALGFVLLMLVHEMGHVIVLRAQGVPASVPLFVPFLGAFVSMKGLPRSVYQEAQSGLAGPAFGTAASLVVEAWGHATGSEFLMRLAFVGFFLNIFNLLPVLPLDGGRAAAALHPALWLVGLVGLLAFEIWSPSPIVPLVLILGGIELWQRWRGRNTAAARAYYDLSRQQRATIGAIYVAILAVALVGLHASYVARTF